MQNGLGFPIILLVPGCAKCCVVAQAACYRLVVGVYVHVYVHLLPWLCNHHQASSKAQDAVSGRLERHTLGWCTCISSCCCVQCHVYVPAVA